MSGAGVRIEDLYDVPPTEIEMIGGYFDGYRMHVPDRRDEWLMPVPVTATLASESDRTRPTMDIQRYRSAGSIRDDGTRVFHAVGQDRR